MKLVKMSLAAAVLLGASAYAIDNVKVSGDASLFYGTNNAQYTKNVLTSGTAGTGSGLFSKDGSYGDTALRLGVTGDLTKGVSFGVTGYALSTLGLENNLVSGVWSGAHNYAANSSKFGADVKDASWIGEAWIAATLGKTTAKIGRMELDTPLAFSEKWSIVPNTFEAAVLINQDIPDTTLVGAWVGKGNGAGAPSFVAPTQLPGGNLGGNGTQFNGVVAQNGAFSTFMNDGAYAAAIINNSFKPLVAQAWYYNVSNIADAYWLQADIDCQLVKGVKIGAQYADLNPKGAINALKDSKAHAFKLGYEGVQNLKLSAAYSQTDAKGVLNVANVATNNSNSQSKLYTETFWNYGYVGAPDATSYMVAAEYNAGFATLTAQYTDVNNKAAVATPDLEHDLKEVAVSATKAFGPLDATLAYVSTDAKDQNNKTVNEAGSRYDSVLAMLKYKF